MVATVAACGSSATNGGAAPGPGSASGTVSGTSLAVADAIAYAIRTTPSADVTYLAVELVNTTNACAVAEFFPQNATKANVTMLLFIISSAQIDSTRLIAAGAYPIGGTGFADGGGGFLGLRASAQLSATNAQCASAIPTSDATDGTITIDAITASVVSGTFDLKFPNGSMTGSFSAMFCTPPDAGTATTDGGVSCVQ